MKIQKLKIKGYKSLKDVEIPSLSYFNMFYGYNNSGKSNVLKALELIFKKKINPSGSNVIVNRAGGRSVDEPLPKNTLGGFSSGLIENSAFLFNFLDTDKKVEFEITVDLKREDYRSIVGEFAEDFERLFLPGNHGVIPIIFTGEITPLSSETANFEIVKATISNLTILELNAQNARVYFQHISGAVPAEAIYSQGYPIVQSILDYFDDCVLLLDNDRYFGKEKESAIEYHEFDTKTFKNWFYNLYLNPVLYPTFLQVIEFVKDFKVAVSAQNPQLKSCEENSPLGKMNVGFSKSQQNEINIMLESAGKRLPLDSFGTGIHQILYILTKIFVSTSKVILIEEVELNLSPRYQGELLKHLNKLRGAGKLDQIFFTTHSKYFSFRNDFSIYELSLKADGNSVCKKVSSPNRAFFGVRTLD